MKVVRKKRGRVYRGALVVVIAMMLAVGALWSASFNRWIIVGFPLTQKSNIEMCTAPGGVQISYNSISSRKLSVSAETYADFNKKLDGAVLRPPETNWWRFRWLNKGSYGIWSFEFPFWILLFALSVWPNIVTVRWFLAKPPKGLCPACGYDLRGSVGAVSCPECGAGILGVEKVSGQGR